MAPSLDESIGSSAEMKNTTAKVSAWQEPSPAAFDFRSDITTTSTPVMLQAIVNAGLNEGWSGNGAADFESHIAQLTSREAALFVISSTMGNQVAIRTYLNRPPNGVMCDARSHLIHQEVGAVAGLSGGLIQSVQPRNGLYLTVEDIKRKVVISKGLDACECPTSMIQLEVPLGGIIMPIHELRRIRQFTLRHDIKLHMDGARLWEAVAAGEASLAEFCAEVDSVNLCLTKGIGAPVGSILIGDKDFIRHARWVRKSYGGAMRQPGINAAMAWSAVNETFGSDAWGSANKLQETHELAKRLADHWAKLGGTLIVPQQTNMIWLDLDLAGIDEAKWEEMAEAEGLQLYCNRLVTHYQISIEAIERLEKFMEKNMADSSRKPGRIMISPRQESVARVSASMREAILFSASMVNEL